MQGVLGGIGVIDLPEWPDGRLMEDGRLVPAAFILALVLNGAEQRELIVVRKGEDISLAVDGSILGGETVIDLIEFILALRRSKGSYSRDWILITSSSAVRISHRPLMRAAFMPV